MQLLRTQPTLNELHTIFESYLFEKGFEGFSPALLGPAQYILKMKAKRIRPMLLLAANAAFGGDLLQALDAACAIEMYHNFTLVHDDIIDEAELRRNEKTLHKAFDLNTAILTGDAMSQHALWLLNKVPRDKHFVLMELFLKIASLVIEGEMLDVTFEDKPSVAIEAYLKMIRLKTSVFLAAALQMGAILGDASEADQQKIYRFGENLGMGFQIKDDYLDTFGNQNIFGKQIGGDILLNKKTYLLCQLQSNPDEGLKKKILEVACMTNPEEKIRQMKALYVREGIDQKARAVIESYYNEAIRNLSGISVGDAPLENLYRLTEKLHTRSV